MRAKPILAILPVSLALATVACVRPKGESATRSAPEAPPPAPPAGRAFATGLVEAINAKSDADGPLDALDVLPDDVLRHHMLVYHSRSVKKTPAGVVPDDAGPEAPRVVAASKDGSRIAAFSSRSFAENPVMEVMELNEGARAWELSTIRVGWDAGARRLKAELDADVTHCKGCHGDPTRPIMDTYNLWPGWYGGAQRTPGTILGDNFEMKSFKALMAARAANPVLARLPGLEGREYSEVHRRLVKSGYSVLNQQNRLIAADLRAGLLAHPDRARLHKALFAAVLGPSRREMLKVGKFEGYLTGDSARSVPARIAELVPVVKAGREAYRDARVEIMRKYRMTGSTPFDFDGEDYARAAALLAFGEVLLGPEGAKRMHWSTQLGRAPSHAFANGLSGLACIALYLDDFAFTDPMPPDRDCQTLPTREAFSPDIETYFPAEERDGSKWTKPRAWPF